MKFGLLPNVGDKYALVAVPDGWLDRFALALMRGRWFDHFIIGEVRVLDEDFKAPLQPDRRAGVSKS